MVKYALFRGITEYTIGSNGLVVRSVYREQMMRFKRVGILLQAIGVLLASGGCFTPGTEQDAGLFAELTAKCLSPEDADRLADQVVELVNLERAQRDLRPVVANATLAKIAENYACRMIETQFFGHKDPLNGHGALERAAAAKYMFYAIGENLAAGPQTSGEVMKAWMESPSHRDIILDPSWREIGVAVRTGGEYAVYWVQEFGDPAADGS